MVNQNILIMKKNIFILFLILNLASFAQSTNEVQVSITKEEIKKAKTLHELIPNFPQDCKIFDCLIILNVSDQVLESKSSDRNFLKETQNLILNKKNKLERFFIQDISSNCNNKLSKIYQFNITK